MAENIDKEGLLPVGTTLANGRYRIEEYLASGGFGNTYGAINTAFDEKVAIKELYIKGVCGRNTSSKEISISLTENQRAFTAQQEKFRKEAKRLRKLSNGHIVQVHDLFDENGTSYYVMDYIDGESLSERLKRTKKPMTESEVMMILPQVLDALECVHNESIWHLDLKPANIMIDKKGNIQLIDFGASKQLRNADGNSLSTSSAMAYTPGFASSEQMEQNIEKFGPWTDLYSLGATMFNLLTMQQPPLPSSVEEEPEKIQDMLKGVSKKTQDLILWMMKKRLMRPKNVAEVKEFLLEVPSKPGPDSDKKDKPGKDGDSGDTIKKIKKPDPNPQPQDPKKTTDSGSNLKKYAVGAIVVACIGVGIIAFSMGGGEAEPKNGADTPVAVAMMKKVTDMDITVSSGPTNMRKYKYTGEIADSTGALPQGKGIAKYAQYGDVPASTYEGNFINGVCEDNTGKATMTFTSGDKFVGTFKGGRYAEGKYILSDKSYFEGSFKDGTPYNGKWCNPDGSLSANVVNGKEQ